MYMDSIVFIFFIADADRVVLSTDHDQPDYINACFLDVSCDLSVSSHLITSDLLGLPSPKCFHLHTRPHERDHW